MKEEVVIVLDFGGQYNQLVARRVRECNVYCEIYSYKTDIEKIKAMNPKGIILTGGPNSCYEPDSPTYTDELFKLGIPVLGLCYGAQLMSHVLGGKVERADVREYGKTEVFIDKKDSKIFQGVSKLGTLEVMKGEVNIDDAVQQYKNTSVKVLAGSIPIQDTSTVLSGKNMRQFVKELEAEADFVIIDTPPSGLLSDAAIVAQYVDGAVFVIRQDYTDVDRILEGMEILSGSGAEITGCILNDVNVRTSESQHYMNSYRTKGETL